MKKITTILTLLIFNLSLISQNSVTFKVDMSEYDGSYEMVNVNGVFNNWCGECAVMTDDNSDGIYEIVVTDLPNGFYEYKFTTNGWNDQEMFNPGTPCTLQTGEFINRTLTVTEDMVLDVVCWESCDDCDAAPTSGDVTFKVDMNDYTGPAFTTVNINGTFNEWCGICAPMDDSDNDGIYEISVNLPLGESEYKFTLDGWDFQEELTVGSSCTTTLDAFTNRIIDVEDDIELDAVCWESCFTCNVGVEENALADLISISPNPSSGLIVINGSGELEDNATVTITNSLGEQIQNLLVSTRNQTVVDLSLQPEGLYFISINNDGVRATKRVVIIK